MPPRRAAVRPRSAAASPAQTPSPARQLPKACATGTAEAAATVVPTVSAIVYAPVTSPVRCGKCCLTSIGRRMFATAIPASASALVARNTTAEPVTARNTCPTVRASIASTSSRAGENRRTSHGVAAPSPANAMVGRVVTNPAIVPERARPTRTSSSSAPRLVTAARRLSATSSIPASTSHAGLTRDVVAAAPPAGPTAPGNLSASQRRGRDALTGDRTRRGGLAGDRVRRDGGDGRG